MLRRSSNRVHDWLLTNRVFGRHLRGYLAGRGVSIWVKVGMLVLLWGTIGVSAGLFVPHLWLRALLGVIGAAVTMHLPMLKTQPRRSGCTSERMLEP